MSSITPNERLIGRLALPLAWFALVAGQLHAMARHLTEDGRSDLDSSLVSSWSDPARDVFSPLLDWADPDIVYVTWGKIWLPVFVVMTLCAFAVHRHRRPVGFERTAWRVALTGYVAACVSVAVEYWTSWTSYHAGIVDGFFPVTILAMLTTVIGSTMLGISLWRRGFRPRSAAILLAAMVPGLVVISSVTSMGSVILPASFAFGILGRRLATGSVQPAQEPFRTVVSRRA